MSESESSLSPNPASLDLPNREEGLFTDQSSIRRISREALPLLGGGRAVLLQLAHPLVAAGVNDHSTFQTDPLDRLFGTLELMHMLVYGSRRQVESALLRFEAMHARVDGTIARSAGPFPGGTTYQGNDPTLKLWVFATLVDTSLISYLRFVGALKPQESEDFYRDALILGQALGIDKEVLPPNLASFQQYMNRMLAGETLTVTDRARQLAWQVLDPQVHGLQYASARLLRFVTAGLLPNSLRRDFELAWSPRRQFLLNILCWTTRKLRPIAPQWLWQSPQLEGASFLRAILWPDQGAD